MKKGIYIITNTIDNRVYIGKFSRTSFEERKRVHLQYLKSGKHHSKKLQNFYNKYGLDSLEFKVLYEYEYIEESDLNTLEGKLIAEYDSFRNGFNMTLGGEGAVGVIRSKEQRELISKRMSEISKERDNSYSVNCSKSNKNKKEVIVNSVKYNSALEASKCLGINYNTLIRYLRDGKEGFSYVIRENLEVNKPMVIEIDGVIYHSYAQAERAIGYSRATIRSRVLDERFPSYKSISRSDTYTNSGKPKKVCNDYPERE